jgi:hypothetical protein
LSTPTTKIEVRTGVSLPTIFEIEGEDGFRKREAQVIAELAARQPCRRHRRRCRPAAGEPAEPAKRAAFVIYLDVPLKRSTNGRGMTRSGRCCRSATRGRSSGTARAARPALPRNRGSDRQWQPNHAQSVLNLLIKELGEPWKR